MSRSFPTKLVVGAVTALVLLFVGALFEGGGDDDEGGDRAAEVAMPSPTMTNPTAIASRFNDPQTATLFSSTQSRFQNDWKGDGDKEPTTLTGIVQYSHSAPCDLVFLRAPFFAQVYGEILPLEIDVKTKVSTNLNVNGNPVLVIEQAAIRIGGDRFDVKGNGTYVLNGEEAAPLPVLLARTFPLTGTSRLVGPNDEGQHELQHEYTINWNEEEWLVITTAQDRVVSIQVDHALPSRFRDCTGIITTVLASTSLDEDGTTMMKDACLHDWTMQDEEPILPPLTLRTSRQRHGRRLGEPSMTAY